jgi:hypothetical protein
MLRVNDRMVEAKLLPLNSVFINIESLVASKVLGIKVSYPGNPAFMSG